MTRDELKAKYPELLKGVDLAIGDGWVKTLDYAFGSMNRWATYGEDGKKVTNLDFVVIQQIKEKFGGLRLYVSFKEGATQNCIAAVRGAANMAEYICEHLCEVCGNEGKLRGGGWVRTLCDEHSDGKPPLRQ